MSELVTELKHISKMLTGLARSLESGADRQKPRQTENRKLKTEN
jgi:hypothetical protein